jgi:hypothetical protein
MSGKQQFFRNHDIGMRDRMKTATGWELSESRFFFDEICVAFGAASFWGGESSDYPRSHTLHQFGKCDSKSSGNEFDVSKGDISLAAFDSPHVGPVHPTFSGERFL